METRKVSKELTLFRRCLKEQEFMHRQQGPILHYSFVHTNTDKCAKETYTLLTRALGPRREPETRSYWRGCGNSTRTQNMARYLIIQSTLEICPKCATNAFYHMKSIATRPLCERKGDKVEIHCNECLAGSECECIC
jgi:hypothetical protein